MLLKKSIKVKKIKPDFISSFEDCQWLGFQLGKKIIYIKFFHLVFRKKHSKIFRKFVVISN
jgi:hypothetical protein